MGDTKEKRAPKTIKSKQVVATSVTVSVLDVTLNLIVAIITGSTVLLAQSLQGLSDLMTGAVVFWGVRRSHRDADHRYQLGYGRLAFFWVVIAGIMMFAGTGILSFYFGYQQFTEPQVIERLWLGLVMLLIGLLGNGYALSMSVRRFKQADKSGDWLRQLLKSSLVETKATFLIDFMGTGGAVIGLVTLGLYGVTGDARFDGAGSMLIGLSMMTVSLILVKDTGSLIAGRSVDGYVQDEIIKASKSIGGVIDVLDLRTMYLGPGKMLALIEVHVAQGLETAKIEKLIDDVKEAVAKHVPDVRHVQVEIETPDTKIKKRRKRPKAKTLK